MPRLARTLATGLAVALAYYVAGKIGLRLAFVNASATAVWPPSGIALAAFLILGSGIWPGVLAGAFLVNLTTAGTVATSLAIAGGNTLEGLIGAFLVQRFASGSQAFRQPHGVFRFAALAGIASTTVSATVGATSLALAGFASWSGYGTLWLTWWLGDAAAILVLTPCLILWSQQPRISWTGRRAVEATLVLIATVAISLLVLSTPGLQSYSVKFLCLPPLLWAAFRFSPREASTGVVVVSVVAVASAIRGLPAADPGSLLVLQGFLGVTSVTMLAAAAEVSERRRIEAWIRQLNQGLEQRVAEDAGQLRVINEEIRDQIRHRVMAAEALEHSESRLREAQKVAHIGSWEWDIVRDVVWWSAALFEIFDVDPEAFGASYEAFLQRVHPDDRAHVQDCIQTALRDAQAFSFECRIVRPGGDLLSLHTRGRVMVDDAGQPIRMIGTGQDITERRRMEEERANLIREQAARLEAEAANRSKDDFLATLSHELRNPLNAIVGWARLLRDGRLDPVAKAHAVEAINRNADLQSQLMLDLLDLSRINADRIELRRRRVSLATVMEAAIETMKPYANARGIALHACIDDHGLEVAGDPDRLQQVIGNLLSNAIRLTPERGNVRVSLTSIDSQASIVIEDDGPGIDPELLPHVFDRFRSGDSRPAKRPGGLGLGLTIVKRLVDLHGGTIQATNVEEGHGAIFRLSLPLAPATSAEANAQDPIATVEEPAHDLHGLRILVVEDEPDSREVLQMVLSEFGAEICVAGSCAEALARFQERAPHVLISDIGLPDADGYELLARVRALPRPGDRAVPAIALTAFAGVEHEREALRRGFQAHLAKPFETARLVQLIDELARSVPSPS